MFMRILTWYIGLLFHYQLLTGSSYPSPILFTPNWFRHGTMRLLPFALSLFGIYHPTRYLTYVHFNKDFNRLHGIVSSPRYEPLHNVVLCIALICYPDTSRGFYKLPHSLQMHVKLNLQLRNHLKIKSVAALPHSIRWSTINYSATSIITHKLDWDSCDQFIISTLQI